MSVIEHNLFTMILCLTILVYVYLRKPVYVGVVVLQICKFDDSGTQFLGFLLSGENSSLAGYLQFGNYLQIGLMVFQ